MTSAMTSGELRQHVIQALRTIYDPEMPVNIYELGLIYEVKADEAGFRPRGSLAP